MRWLWATTVVAYLVAASMCCSRTRPRIVDGPPAGTAATFVYDSWCVPSCSGIYGRRGSYRRYLFPYPGDSVFYWPL